MPILRIVNKKTGEIGWQARSSWKSPAGGTRYFYERLYGPRKAKRLAREAEIELMRMARKKGTKARR